MKKLLIFLLILSISLAQVDVHRDIFYEIDDDMNVHTTYVDYFYNSPQATLEYIQSFESETKYIEERTAPDFDLKSFEIETNENYTMIKAIGQYDSYVLRERDTIKIGGKGFIDRTCKDYPFEILTPIKQTFHTEVKIPEDWEVTEIPAPAHTNNLIKFDYNASAEESVLYEDVYFELKNTTTVTFYCGEREQINEVLKAGFTAKEKNDSWIVMLIIASVTIIMFAITRFMK